MVKARKYQEQFDRLKRWYGRFEKIDQGRPHTVASDYYIDEIYAFFINCYHLKDWIQNDETVRLPQGKIEHFVHQNECMRVCKDICNGIKHLKRKSYSGGDPEFGPRKFSLDLGEPTTIIKVKYSIITKTGTIDAFQLASECLQRWKEFIKRNII